jgi:hypothetical protein
MAESLAGSIRVLCKGYLNTGTTTPRQIASR